MLADYTRQIHALEAKVEGAYERAERAGTGKLPRSVYANLDEIRELREQAATATIDSNQEAIEALALATNGHDCAEARLIRRVIAFLQNAPVSKNGTERD